LSLVLIVEVSKDAIQVLAIQPLFSFFQIYNSHIDKVDVGALWQVVYCLSIGYYLGNTPN